MARSCGSLIRCRTATGEDHVLILDEMNRANLPRVFGELMYLLEYRGESADLLYTQDFSLPKNLLFIGTMNTADRPRSRRRFLDHLVAFSLRVRPADPPSPRSSAAFDAGRRSKYERGHVQELGIHGSSVVGPSRAGSDRTQRASSTANLASSSAGRAAPLTASPSFCRPTRVSLCGAIRATTPISGRSGSASTTASNEC